MSNFTRLSIQAVFIIVLLAAAWYIFSPKTPVTISENDTSTSLRQVDEEPALSTSSEWSETSETIPELSLQSILSPAGEDAAVATIALDEKSIGQFNVGDDVFGVAKLELIESDHVVLQAGDDRIWLYLQNDEPQLFSDETSTDPTADEGTGPYGTHSELQHKLRTGELSVMTILEDASYNGQSQKYPKAKLFNKTAPPESENRKAIYENARANALQEQSDLTWAFIEYEPEVGQDGITGVRLTGQEELDLLHKHGLEYGDVITSVNGSKINNQSAVMSAMEQIGEARHLKLAIERDGQPQIITIEK